MSTVFAIETASYTLDNLGHLVTQVQHLAASVDLGRISTGAHTAVQDLRQGAHGGVGLTGELLETAVVSTAHGVDTALTNYNNGIGGQLGGYLEPLTIMRELDAKGRGIVAKGEELRAEAGTAAVVGTMIAGSAAAAGTKAEHSIED